ncbi:MAG: nucleotide exchange factor GrpE [Vallitaleaceae bacterium]|jgi:molecular chaperone GrpE|nr:nucleotide exchange factor GrpE [Vallitaleaceae bacterium]
MKEKQENQNPDNEAEVKRTTAKHKKENAGKDIGGNIGGNAGDVKIETVGPEDIELEEDEVVDSPQDEADDDSVTDIKIKLSAFQEKELEAKENFDKWKRTLAEFDNFRKRTIKEKSIMYENGTKDVVEKLLPVLDNFERALSHISEEEKDSAVAKGITMIYKQLLNTFNELGIVEIDATGKEFDPNLHHAVSHEESDEYGENEVVEVLQKGFIYKERVIRHSMVRVAN